MNYFVIKSLESRKWLSCKTIIRQLEIAFSPIAKTLNWSPQKQEIESPVNDFKTGFRTFIIIEDLPHPISFIEWVNKNNVPARFVFFIYGGANFYAKQWLLAANNLLGRQVLFICASSASASQFSKYLNPPHSIQVVPFPVEHFSAKETINVRWIEDLLNKKSQKHQIKLIYAGRISQQKNIDLLVKVIARLQLVHPQIHLYLAGFSDDIGMPLFFGPPKAAFEYDQVVLKELSTLSSKQKKSVTFLGALDARELSFLYAKMDYFITLSLFHDEDFGMAPIEAAFRGTPSILSTWGGFHDLLKFHQAHCAVPVEFTQTGPHINETQLLKILEAHFSSVTCQNLFLNKEKMVNQHLAHYSTESVSAKLISVVQNDSLYENFHGLSPSFKTFFLRLQEKECLFDQKEAKVDPLYQEFYRPYWTGETYNEGN